MARGRRGNSRRGLGGSVGAEKGQEQRQLGIRQHREQGGSLAVKQSTPTRNVRKPRETHSHMSSWVVFRLDTSTRPQAVHLLCFHPKHWRKEKHLEPASACWL